MQVFGGRVFFIQGNYSLGAATFSSAMWLLPSVPLTPVAKPTSPIFTADPGLTDWNDFSIQDENTIWVAATSGLYLYSTDGSSGTWTYTLYDSVQNLLFVGVSGDGNSVYVTTADGVYAFDTSTGQYTNNGAPILTAPSGRQFRGVAAVPVLPVPSQTRTASRTSSATPSSTRTPSNTPSITPTPTSTVSATSSLTASASQTLSVGAVASATATVTSSPSVTASASSTASNTPTASVTNVANWFNSRLGFAATRIINGTVATDTSTSIRVQRVFVDDFSGCDGTSACTRRRSIALPFSTAGNAGSCVISSQQQQGRLALSANGEALSLYCMNGVAGNVLTASSDLDGTVVMIYYNGLVDVSRRVLRAYIGGAGNGFDADNLPCGAGSEVSAFSVL